MDIALIKRGKIIIFKINKLINNRINKIECDTILMEIHLLSPHFLIYIKFNLCKFNFGRNKLKEIVITFILSCFFFYIYNKEVKFVDSSCVVAFLRDILYI